MVKWPNLAFLLLGMADFEVGFEVRRVKSLFGIRGKSSSDNVELERLSFSYHFESS